MSTLPEWLQTLLRVYTIATNDILNTCLSFHQYLRHTKRWICNTPLFWRLYGYGMLELNTHVVKPIFCITTLPSYKPPFRFPNGFANIGASSLLLQASSVSCVHYVLHPAVTLHPSQYWWRCTSWHWLTPPTPSIPLSLLFIFSHFLSIFHSLTLLFTVISFAVEERSLKLSWYHTDNKFGSWK
jgi:hypothetical protein